jgi:hypothetical protein
MGLKFVRGQGNKFVEEAQKRIKWLHDELCGGCSYINIHQFCAITLRIP